MVKPDVHRKQDKTKFLPLSIQTKDNASLRSQSHLQLLCNEEDPYIPIPLSPSFVRTEEKMLN
jgi:hypothetical protein